MQAVGAGLLGGAGGDGLKLPSILDIAQKSVQYSCMEIVTYSETRANLKAIMDRVVNDHTPIAITRQRGKPVVMVDLDDWNAMRETMYLLSTPNNTKRLMESIAELDAGKGVERELIEP